MLGICSISAGAQPCFYCFSAGKLPARQAPERCEFNPAADLAKRSTARYALALAGPPMHAHSQASRSTRRQRLHDPHLTPLPRSESRSRGYPVTGRRTHAIAAIALALLGGCAPDAFRRDPAFEAWISEVRKECYRERIGTDTVGNLLGHTEFSFMVFSGVAVPEWPVFGFSHAFV
jgi:hypothetical protein